MATVETSTGRLVGTTVPTQDGAQVHLWQGVPYALSTAGQNRFASPVAPNDTDKCEAVLAMQPRPPCAQWVDGKVLGSEDCLHLNIWAPATASHASRKRPLVMAATGHWFQRSTNDVPQWADLAAKGDAVVVAPNVRLGVLGFLHPKNVQGLTPDVAEEDMMLAMQWAMDNAAVFGADASALMLFGNGSGAYMLVQAAGRLNVPVSRAIIEGSVYISGVPANAASMDPSEGLAQKLGCDATNRTTWFSCFTGVQLDKLLSTAAQMEMRFSPVWDPLYIIVGTSLKKLPTIKEVIAGTDAAQQFHEIPKSPGCLAYPTIARGSVVVLQLRSPGGATATGWRTCSFRVVTETATRRVNLPWGPLVAETYTRSSSVEPRTITSPSHSAHRSSSTLYWVRPACPSWVQTPSLEAGRPGQLRCIASGSRPPAQLSWWKGSQRLPAITTTTDAGSAVDGPASSSTLTITPSVEDDGRQITCRALNERLPHATVEDVTTIRVLSAHSSPEERKNRPVNSPPLQEEASSSAL
ncbi:neuroligin-4, Y-linked-like [Rhipicephalus sanguineus]|uniref:neuroligin-4, Y-linked-like n=1 Tax=Rhipicephalus sanguineus TaxID=34632 RepID=UPI0020C1ED92|nr:neuroligin-4, Y-linked-like [Rhipicephalus sanguineus]